MNDLAKALQKPFSTGDIEWRPQGWGKQNSGEYWVKVLAYVTNRAIMNRLDEVVGPDRWENKFRDWHNGAQLCCISISFDERVPNRENTTVWVSKWDGAEQTHIEGIKGGLSDSMKRAAVQWGIGRYLYKLDSNFATTSTDRKPKEQGWNYFSADGDKGKGCKEGEWHTFYWLPPELPAWALPEGKSESATTHETAKTNGTIESRTPLDILKSLMEVCTSMNQLENAWGAATPELRKKVGAEFLRQQKERLEVPA